jgi:hypothetical protein
MGNMLKRSPAAGCPGLPRAGESSRRAPNRSTGWLGRLCGAWTPWFVVLLAASHAVGIARGQREEPPRATGSATVETRSTVAEEDPSDELDSGASGTVPDGPPPSQPSTPEPLTAAPEPPVSETVPELYYLENEAGRLVPVPGFQYRDFVELLRLREGMPKLPTPPQAVLERLEMNLDVRLEQPPENDQGRVPQSSATIGSVGKPGILSIELTVVQASTGWVGLPLELSEALFTAPPEHETIEGASGRFLLDANADGSGYRGWFQGEPGTRHRVVLTGKLPVERANAGIQFGIDVPRANASQLTVISSLSTPAVVIEPAGLPPQIVDEGSDGTRVSLVGLVGPTQVRVSSEQAVLKPLAAAPHATSNVVVTVNGRQARTDAAIEIEHLPRGRRTLTLQLPAFAKLETLSAPAGLVSLTGTDEAPQAVISVDPDASGRAVIELSCEAPVEPDGRPLEVFGFLIGDIPAWRQWGQISILVEGDWQLDWRPDGPLRRVDPPLLLRRRGCVAAFAYDAQPASLALEVRPLRSRVVVEPEYRIRVAASRVELEARLRVAVRGAPISQFRVGLDNGWEVEDVGPAGLVDTAGVVETGGGVDIPFVQGLSGDAVVEIRAARSVPRDAERVEWTFPAPTADLVGPASVVILPESDIELTPDADAIAGLVRQVASPTVSRSSETFPPFLLNEGGEGIRPESAAIAYRLDGPTGQFSASRRFLPRRVAASLATRLDVRSTEISVDQSLQFDVAHVPLEVVELLVPKSVAANGTLEVRQGDRLLASQPAADRDVSLEDSAAEVLPGEKALPPAGADTAEVAAETGMPPTIRTRVMLPNPLLGTGELTIRYRLPATPPPAETTLAEEVPLVMPVGARFGKQSVTLEVARGLSVEVRGELWKREMAVQGTTMPRSWASSRPQESIRLAISAEPRNFGQTVVHAAWLQTRLLPGQRQDIYRYRVTTSVDSLDIELPPLLGGELEEDTRVEVLLDGRPLPDVARTERRIGIELFAGGTIREYEIELVFRQKRASGLRPVALAAPVFPEGAVERRFYWELRLSPDEHLLSYPRGWTAQQEWGWDTIGFLPRAIVSPQMLQAWISPSTEMSIGRDEQEMPYADRRLVFSGVGHPDANSLWIVPSWLLVLACSGPTLLLGLLFVQWPLLRKTGFVMTIAVLATAAAAVFPWRAVLVVQAAMPGMLLTVLAAGLRVALSPAAASAAAGDEGDLYVSQSSTRTALAAFVPGSSRERRRLSAERSAS